MMHEKMVRFCNAVGQIETC